ncbi:MAG: ABC transporter permease [Deltaproteobacteria bacterium]|nr:ABC transporter permease [Deltaproteobacteria bacterium]
MIQAIGRETIRGVTHLLDTLAFFRRLSAKLYKRPRAGRKLVVRFTLEQIYFTAIESLPVLVFIALITGSMIIMQFAKHFSTLEGRAILGDLVVLLIIRELGPLFTALIVLLRSAVAATVETATMKVTGELEALELQGIDPLYLVGVPRLIGTTAAMLCLFIVFDIAAILGGYCIAWIATNMPLERFLEGVGQTISGIDIAVGIVKAALFGMTITVVSLYRGFSVAKAVTRVPIQTSKAAMESLLYCVFVNIAVSVVFYV